MLLNVGLLLLLRAALAAVGCAAAAHQGDGEFTPIIIPTQKPSLAMPGFRHDRRDYGAPSISPPSSPAPPDACPTAGWRLLKEPLAAGEHEEGWVAPTVPGEDTAPPSPAPAAKRTPGVPLPAGEHEEGWVAPSVPGEDTAPPTPAAKPTAAKPHKTLPSDDHDNIAIRKPTPQTTPIPDADNYESVMSTNGQSWYLGGIILCSVIVLVW
jgi:hypothetical protein